MPLLDSFLDAFSKLADIHNKQEQTKQDAVKFAVDNALAQQKLDVDRDQLKQQTAYQTAQQAETAKYHGEETAARAAETERKTASDLNRDKWRMGQLKNQEDKLTAGLTKQQLIEYMKAKTRYVLIGYDPEAATATAMQDILAVPGFGAPTPAVPPTTAQPGISPVPIGEPGQAMQGPQGPILGAPQQAGGIQGPAPLIAARTAHLDALTAHTNAETEILTKMEDVNKAYKEAQTKAVVARTVREELITKLMPEQWQFKKLIENGKLNVAKMNANANMLRAQVSQNGPDARAALAQAHQNAIALRQYEREMAKDFNASRNAANTAEGAVSYAGSVLKQLSAKQKLTPGEEDLKLKATAMLDEYNAKDGSGKSKLDYAREEKAQSLKAYQEAQKSAKDMESVYQKPVTDKGGFAPQFSVPGLRAVPLPRLGKALPDLGVPAISSKSDYDKLPKGAKYKAPDGKVHIKGQ